LTGTTSIPQIFRDENGSGGDLIKREGILDVKLGNFSRHTFSEKNHIFQVKKV